MEGMSVKDFPVQNVFLDDIESQLDRDIERLLKVDREEAAFVAERIDMPLMELLEEHHACFARPALSDGRTEPTTLA